MKTKKIYKCKCGEIFESEQDFRIHRDKIKLILLESAAEKDSFIFHEIEQKKGPK